MPVPVFGVAAGENPLNFPASPVPITRGAGDNFAIGAGTVNDGVAQSAAYGAGAATLIGTVVGRGLTSNLFRRSNPAAGLQNWTIGDSGNSDFNSRSAVMTFAGVNLAAPVRGFTTREDGFPPEFAIAVALPAITADEISVAYVSWNGASGPVVLTATGATTIRRQVTDGGNGYALMTSTTNGISFTNDVSVDIRIAAAILTGEAAAVDPPVLTGLEVVTNPNTDHTPGVTLDPIQVRAVDQFGATWLGAIGGAVVTTRSVGGSPAVPVNGTLALPFVNGVLTLSDIVVPVEEPPPGGGVAVLSGPLAIAAVSGRSTFNALVLTL